MGDGKREIIAYAITHAPRGVRGGPYESWRWRYGSACSDLREALRWCSDSPLTDAEWVTQVLKDVRAVIPHARVIRIVRKARPKGCQECAALRAALEAATQERDRALRDLVMLSDVVSRGGQVVRS